MFVVFGAAPSLVPGGVPTGFLEFGGTHANLVETGFGAIIAAIGASILRFGLGRKFVSAGAVAVVIVLSFFSVISSFNNSFVFTEIDITIQYGPHDQGYFGPAQQVLPASPSAQNVTVDEGSSFVLSFTINESALSGVGDEISSVKAAVPDFDFTITSVHPSLPIAFTPGSSVRVTVDIVAPYFNTGQTCPPGTCDSRGYHGPISLVLTTTG